MKPTEILEKEDLCVEEHAPFCKAECPVHFDTRNMCTLIENGDYKAAYELYKKAVLFPGIVSSGCDAPCEKKCKRAESGGSVRINELERFITEYGKSERGKSELGKYSTEIPKSNIIMSKKLAVIGDGIDSLSIINVLLGKGYSPELFLLNQELRTGSDDFDFLGDIRVIKHVGQQIDNTRIEYITDNYDAVYISTHTKENFYIAFNDIPECQKHFHTIDTDSIIELIFHGKHTAVSIDRFLKGVSMTAGRKNEGSYETQLYTSLSGIMKEAPIEKTGSVYTEDEVKKEAVRCIKCRCLECLKQCMFMEKFDKYPRQYIREVFNNITTSAFAGGMGFRKATPAINSCTMCGLCGEICPNSIPVAEITGSAREVLVSGSVMPPRYHEFPLRDMLYSNSDKVSFFKNPPGKSKSGYLFFPGCQLAATYPEFIRPVYEYLSGVLDDNVGLMLGCCGAPAIWAGETGVYKEVMGRFRQIWEDAGKPVIITACPTCNREFSEALPEAKLTTVWHYYNTYPLPDPFNELLPDSLSEKSGGDAQKLQNISVHDPCTSRYRPDMHEEIRSILAKRGYKIEEYEYSKNKTRCCGYGGLISYNNASLARDFSGKRLSETKDAIVTYCSVCRDVLAGSDKPVYHILDLIYGIESRERGLREKTGISEKMKNRVELYRSLLKTVWGEEPAAAVNEYDAVSLIISDKVRKILEDRLILEDNVREVIYEAEETGKKAVDPKTNHFTACKKIGIVTYWVV